MMTPDDWVLLGYRAREKCPKPDWLTVDNVEEIASVSTCIVPSIAVPWTPQAQNMMGFHATPEEAKHSVDTNRYFIDGYRLLDVQYQEGVPRKQTIAECFRASMSEDAREVRDLRLPIAKGFRILGYDAVSRSVGLSFQHSPLPCNGMAKEIPVNRYCLIDRLEDAIEAARRFSIGEAEPGTYYVVEVWREVVEA